MNYVYAYIKLGRSQGGGVYFWKISGGCLIFEFYCSFKWQFQKFSQFQCVSGGPDPDMIARGVCPPVPCPPNFMYVCMPSILTFHAAIITWRGNDATKILKLKMPWNSSDDYELCFTNSVNRLTSWRWMQAGCEIGWSLSWQTFSSWKSNHFYYGLSKSFFSLPR